MNKDSVEQTANLTMYVAEFICDTRLDDLPADVVALGKKSILDGLGLALSGGATHCGGLVRQHFSDLNLGAGPATVIEWRAAETRSGMTSVSGMFGL